MSEIHWAARKGNVAEVKKLLRSGVDIEEVEDVTRVSSWGWGASVTPLLAAACCGQTEVVRLLLKRGAKIDARANNSPSTPLLDAVYGGHVQTARLLIERGADIEAKTYTRDLTPLGYAVSGGYIGLVELLLSRGAEVNVSDNAGKTVQDMAREQGDTAIAELLSRAQSAHSRGFRGKRSFFASVRRLVGRFRSR